MISQVITLVNLGLEKISKSSTLKIVAVKKENNLPLIFVWGLLALVFYLFLLNLSLSLAYKNKFYPRTKISGINLSGKTKKAAVEVLTAKNQDYLANQQLSIDYQGEKTRLDLQKIEAKFDADQSVESIFETTHNGLISPLLSLIKNNNQQQSIQFNQEELDKVLLGLTKGKGVEPKDASLKITNNSITFSEAQMGEGIDLGEAKEEVKNQISWLSSQEINLKKSSLRPKINDTDLAQAYFKTAYLLQNKGFDLKRGKNVIYQVDASDLKNWLEFEKKTYANFEDTGMFKGRVAGVSISSKDDSGIFALPQLIRNEETLEAYLDTTKINDFILNLAAKIDQAPEDAKLGILNNTVVVIKKESRGQELDKEKLLHEINLRLNSSSENDIELPVKSLVPEIRSDNISELGIKEKIAQGVSGFAGSPKNRINNLTIGTTKFDGVMIKPDEVASFAKIVGEVDESQGYLPELVIKGNQTIQELGGGMCQVSTTFYRAALNAGLPIVERHSHAYLVGYYKDGPDATVYVPSTDLKFKNDTGHYILVQTKIDTANKKVYFDFWGTNDGRKVTVDPPLYTDIVPAPTEPYYVDDPTYPTGYQIEEEHPHEGTTGTIIRTITYPDGKTKTDTIKSAYKPWPAKIRRGTGPADLPIPPKE